MINYDKGFAEQVCEICWDEEATNTDIAQQVTDLVLLHYGGKPDDN